MGLALRKVCLRTGIQALGISLGLAQVSRMVASLEAFGLGGLPPAPREVLSCMHGSAYPPHSSSSGYLPPGKSYFCYRCEPLSCTGGQLPRGPHGSHHHSKGPVWQAVPVNP